MVLRLSSDELPLPTKPQPGEREAWPLVRLQSLQTVSRSTISNSWGRVAFFVDTERSTRATAVFFTREGRVPSSESYCRVLVGYLWATSLKNIEGFSELIALLLRLCFLGSGVSNSLSFPSSL